MRAMRLAVALAAALLGLTAATAGAHEGNPSFRSEVTGITPPTEGIEIQVLNFDDSLRLQNRSGSEVLIRGYEEEPYIRIGADGTVELNRNATAYYLNDDRFAESEVPEGVDGEARPDWELVDRSGSFSWHDHRAHWMSRTVPPQVTDESKRTKIFDYEIPIEIDGRQGAIEGTLTWVGEDSGLPLAPFIGLGAAAVLGLTVVLIRRRREPGEEREAW